MYREHNPDQVPLIRIHLSSRSGMKAIEIIEIVTVSNLNHHEEM